MIFQMMIGFTVGVIGIIIQKFQIKKNIFIKNISHSTLHISAKNIPITKFKMATTNILIFGLLNFFTIGTLVLFLNLIILHYIYLGFKCWDGAMKKVKNLGEKVGIERECPAGYDASVTNICSLQGLIFNYMIKSYNKRIIKSKFLIQNFVNFNNSMDQNIKFLFSCRQIIFWIVYH